MRHYMTIDRRTSVLAMSSARSRFVALFVSCTLVCMGGCTNDSVVGRNTPQVMDMAAPDMTSADLAGSGADLSLGAFCGGFAGVLCQAGELCIDDPNDACDPSKGAGDCTGFCHGEPAGACGGLVGVMCPPGRVCVDDPTDACDPSTGGVDCTGTCQ